MTQKELLYLEDAIGHEKTLIKVCEESMDLLDDEDLITFMEDELKIHKDIEKNLLKLLEDKVNE